VTQDALQTGLSAAQEILAQNVKSARKNLKQAQKNIGPLTASVQDNIQSGLSQAQVTLQKSAKKAGKSLKQAQGSLKDTRDSVQAQVAQYRRKRRRAKMLFRMGLISGLILMLLFAPWPGSESRRQIVEFWQGLFPSRQ